jgi:hypothetical protein
MLFDLALHDPQMSLVIRPYGHARDTAGTFLSMPAPSGCLVEPTAIPARQCREAYSYERLLGGVRDQARGSGLPRPSEARRVRTHEGRTGLTGRTAGRTLGVMGVVKRSVSFDSGLWDDLQREVGSGPVSPLVNDALALYLRRERGLAAVASYEAEHGVFTDTELAEADRLLDAACLVDLRIAEPPPNRAQRTVKQATRSRRART